jgi:hypothetical protein
MLWYLGMALVMIVALHYLFAVVLGSAGRLAGDRPGRSLLRGMLFIVAVPVAAAVCFVTFVGVPLGVLLLLGYAVVLVSGGVLTALVAAFWLRDRTAGDWKAVRTVFVALGIWILLRLIAATPLFGWLLYGILVCIAFGAILGSLKWRRRGGSA